MSLPDFLDSEKELSKKNALKVYDTPIYKNKIKNISLRAVLYVVTCVLLTAIHTIMVLTMIFIFQNTMNFSEGFVAIIKTIFAVNCALEMSIAAVIVPLVAFAISKAKPSLSVYSTKEVNNYEKD